MRVDEATRLLVGARQRLSDPARWVQYYRAVDANDRLLEPTHPEAVRWCAIGALEAEAGWPRKGRPGRALHAATVRLYESCGRAPESINDERGHAAVLEMYDEAIARK